MNRVPLDNVDHHDLRVAVRHGAAWGDACDLLPLFPAEFEEAQRDYPIVFRRGADGIAAYALAGVDPGENLFLDGGRWTSRYVPAAQRRGPFALAAGDHDAAPAILIDLDDPRVGAAHGVALFREHGGPSPYLDHVARALDVVAAGERSAAAANAALDAAGLLRPIALRIDLGAQGGRERADLMTVDGDALAALGGDALERLHRGGLLRAAVMAASSLANVGRLVERKTQRLAAA